MIDEAEAADALKALGIVPNRDLIKSWIRAAAAEQGLQHEVATPRAPTPAPSVPAAPPVQPPPQPQAEQLRPKLPRGYSKSNLEPALRQQGKLEQPHGVRRPGRPRVIASWFPEVAKTMADGTTLPEALKQHGITLDKTQIRAVYRNEEFKKLYQDARHTYQRSDVYFNKTIRRAERFRRTLWNGADPVQAGRIGGQ